MIEITDINDPAINSYLNLKSKINKEAPYFIADGTKTVKELLHSDLKIIDMFSTKEKLNELMAEGYALPDTIYTCSKKIMEKVVGHQLHQGIMARSCPREESRLDQLGPAIVLLDQITNTQNIGLIMRAALCFGIDSFIRTPSSPPFFIRRVARTSMGALFKSKTYTSHHLKKDLEQLNSLGYKTFSTNKSNQARPIAEVQLPLKSIFILGSEGNGVSRELAMTAQQELWIPMKNEMDSLNVSSAASILFYQYAQSSSHP